MSFITKITKKILRTPNGIENVRYYIEPIDVSNIFLGVILFPSATQLVIERFTRA